MSRRRPLSEEERALWTGFVRSIRPLDASRERSELPEPSQPAKVSAKDDKSVSARPRVVVRHERPPEKKPPEKTAPPLAPLGRRLKQRVARGREAIDARLDLHGFTQVHAHAELLRFLRRAQADGARIVLVVTGKGAGKGGDAHERGVLKRQVPLWLSLPEFRSLIVGFEDAHAGHGGAGALYVRLRRARRSGD
ncbi:MAG: Smr/MutS family protein [Xanthobacteraceae bacterium]